MTCRRPFRKDSGKLSICLNVQSGVPAELGAGPSQLVHLILEGQGLPTLEDAPQFVLLLAQHYIAASLCGGIGGAGQCRYCSGPRRG